MTIWNPFFMPKFKISEFIPPIAYRVKRALTNRLTMHQGGHRQMRPCHLHELFINHEGNIYPCCITWGRPDMLIGHLADINIEEKILKYNQRCSCEQYHLRKANKNEPINIGLLNIEFSLACQGQCAMCCVDAPSWKGKYDYYDALTAIFNLLSPRQLVVQGGEVLIQKKTMAWLETIKNKSPETSIGLVTNGNVSLAIVPAVESIFDSVAISMVGFQPETYNRIMGMDV